MDVQRFQKLSKWISYLLIGLGGLFSCAYCFLAIKQLLSGESINLRYDNTGFLDFTIGVLVKTEKAMRLAGCSASMMNTLFLSLTTIKAGVMFRDFSSGKTPFSKLQIERLKQIAMFLFGGSLATQVMFCILASIIGRGFYISISLNSQMILGLIIYALVEIFRYGMALQKLSDETV